MQVHHNTKSILATLSLLAVVSGGALLATQLSVGLGGQDVSNWKLCRNLSAGYELKYPRDWYVYGKGSSSTVAPIIERETECSGPAVAISPTKLADKYPSSDEEIFRISVSDQDRLQPTVFAGTTNIDAYRAVLKAADREVFTEVQIGGEKALSRNLYGYEEIKVFHDSRLFELSEQNVSPDVFNAIVDSLNFLP